MLVAFSVTPLGIGEGVGEVVAEAVRVVRESGLPNQTDAMFTTVEGDWVGINKLFCRRTGCSSRVTSPEQQKRCPK